MRSYRLQSLRLVRVAFASILPVLGARQIAAQSAAPRATKQLQPADLKAWKSIRQTVLSNDGKWFAYVLAPNEGDATLIVRSTGPDGKETKYPIGEAGGAGGGRGGPPGADGGAAAQPVAISADSRWLAYTIYPAATAGRAGGRGGAGRGGAGRGGAAQDQAAAAPAQNKMGLVNLASGEKKEFDKVRRFAFNGDKPTWIAMQSFPEQAAPAAGGAGGTSAAAPRTLGTDLVLYNLTTADAVNVGNVAEFGFDDSGDWLAYAVDARDQIGNGVQLRNMRTDVVRPIDSDRAFYRHLAWAD